MTSFRCLGLLLMGILFAPTPASAQGPTFKGGQITWKATRTRVIDFNIQDAWRRDAYSTENGRCVSPVTLTSVPCSGADGFADTGDVIVEREANTTFDPGDASGPVGSPLGPLLYLITSVDYSNNLVYGNALDPASLPALDFGVTHRYAASGVYRAFVQSSSRMSTVEGTSTHVNNGDQAFRVETLVNVGGPTVSPLGGVAPVVLCGIDEICKFPINAFDASGDGLQFRMSADFEAAGALGTFFQPGPPHAPNPATIDPDTGVYSWDTTLATVAPAGFRTFYSTQVTIESLTPAITGPIPPPVIGTVPITDTIASKIALDFLIELVKASGRRPSFDRGPIGRVVVAKVGRTFRTTISASDRDRHQRLTLNAYGLPLGAVMRPEVPRSRTGEVQSRFTWKPTSNQLGYHLITFVVNDSGNRQRFGSMVVLVEPRDRRDRHDRDDGDRDRDDDRDHDGDHDRDHDGDHDRDRGGDDDRGDGGRDDNDDRDRHHDHGDRNDGDDQNNRDGGSTKNENNNRNDKKN